MGRPIAVIDSVNPGNLHLQVDQDSEVAMPILYCPSAISTVQ